MKRALAIFFVLVNLCAPSALAWGRPTAAVFPVHGSLPYMGAGDAREKMGVIMEPGGQGRRAQATRALLLDWLVGAYEALEGRPLPLEKVTVSPGAASPLRKAALLGLITPEELAAGVNGPLTLDEAVCDMLRWAQIVEDAHFHTAALPATIADAQAALQLAADLAGAQGDVAAVWPTAKTAFKATPLTRARYARGALAALTGVAPDDEGAGARRVPMLDDTQNLYARRACAYGLMGYVTRERDGALCFDPGRVMTRGAVWAHALSFARVAWGSGPAARSTLVVGEAEALLRRLLDAFEGHPRFEGEGEVVDNGAPWPWYFAQDGSGAFSANNCMPAAAAMALRWLNRDSGDTPESLRALYPLEGRPWHPRQVEDALKRRDAAYALRGIGMDAMLDSLDSGHILIVLLNEGASGHCVVVKGYMREGAGLWFLTYDPISPSDDACGNPIGRDRRIEASELIFAMRCHWSLYFDIARGEVD